MDVLFSPGFIITIALLLIPFILIAIIVSARALALARRVNLTKELDRMNAALRDLSAQEQEQLEARRRQLEFRLSGNELSGNLLPCDSRGVIINVSEREDIRFIPRKKKSQPRHNIDPALTRLILWYLGCATAWLLFGTTVGEYLGIKFIAPDADHVSWLSFGRLRPVHTNAVFWGWASLAMIGLACYVVPRVSNTRLSSIRSGYLSLALINLAVITGTVCLMAGINNSGGEYREYVWPVMLLFGVGVFVSMRNLFRTIAARTTKEIYVSNWYIVSAMMFVLVIAVVAYWPSWQNGLGETIAQGYYMHQGVGMWFMLFSLGLMYYFLPQQLNKPIYSYSLGIIAFWSQILFYTLIGTHHFIFSAIPWWLQTVAIVGSAGMLIPVVAGTTNFLLTFSGSWHKLGTSYTLPFYLVGIVFYFTGSFQGTAEAFRFTNLVWHFTDFTVAHSHLTMYGIISFMLWAFIYTIVPRLTGNEPSKTLVGAHFWLALVGLLFYVIPLMWGATLKGMLWMEGGPFIESVRLMEPYWLWRAIGGTLMWISHIVFAYNFYVMVRKKTGPEIPSSPLELLRMRAMRTEKPNVLNNEIL